MYIYVQDINACMKMVETCSVHVKKLRWVVNAINSECTYMNESDSIVMACIIIT